MWPGLRYHLRMPTPPLPPDHLPTAALHWALAHVIKVGDTDLLPVPFEFGALRSVWPSVLPLLEAIDLSRHEVGAANRMLAPKSTNGFRAIVQLDPFDSLLYTALTFEAAPTLEAARMGPSQEVAFSHRVELRPDGQFFSSSSGWKEFHRRGEFLARAGDFTHVVCADISDCYNQLYHHRVQGAIEGAGVGSDRSKNIERFLSGLTSTISRGIPVGPSASNLIAEACLSDVDTSLVRKGYVHTRFVDDFRIFARDRREAVEALHDLSDYLHKSHRLALQGTKTKIHSVADFIAGELIDIEELEQSVRDEQVAQIMEAWRARGISMLEDEDVTPPPGTDLKATSEAIRELFEALVTGDDVTPAFMGYVLRRATALRIRALLPLVLANLDRLVPVLRDVIPYILRFKDARSSALAGAALRRFITESDYRNLPFVQTWVLHAFVANTKLCPANDAFRLALRAHPDVRDRFGALLARAHRSVEYVRERKETVLNHTPWAQRAIIWAGSILPRDERTHWLSSLSGTPNRLSALIASAAAAAPA